MQARYTKSRLPGHCQVTRWVPRYKGKPNDHRFHRCLNRVYGPSVQGSEICPASSSFQCELALLSSAQNTQHVNRCRGNPQHAHNTFTRTLTDFEGLVSPSSTPSDLEPPHHYPGTRACPAVILLLKIPSQRSMYQVRTSLLCRNRVLKTNFHQLSTLALRGIPVN